MDRTEKKLDSVTIERTWKVPVTLDELEKEKADRIAMIATNQSQIDIHQAELTKIQNEINMLE